MFQFGCCCTDDKDSQQFSIPPPPDSCVNQDGTFALVRQSPSTLHRPRALELPPTPVPIEDAQLGLGQDQGGQGLTAREKAQLRDLVNTFAKQALKGSPCEYLRESTLPGEGERYRTEYRIDRNLGHLLIMDSVNPSIPEVTCPISAIQDIYSFEEDGAECFPASAMSKLAFEERPLLLMVVYRASESKIFRFCLLEESAESRDAFLKCMRILCLYSRAATKGNGKTRAIGLNHHLGSASLEFNA